MLPFFLAKAKPQESSNLWLACHRSTIWRPRSEWEGEIWVDSRGYLSKRGRKLKGDFFWGCDSYYMYGGPGLNGEFPMDLFKTWSKFDLKGDFFQSKNHISLPKQQFWGCDSYHMAVLV